MPKFSKTSLARLNTIHPDLSKIFKTVIEFRDCSVLCGVRSRAEQNRAYRIGKSKVLWPNSKHNVIDKNDFAAAVDVAPYFKDENPSIIWPDMGTGLEIYSKQVGLYYYFAGYVQAIADSLKIAIRWGGDWDSDGVFIDQNFDDLVHFELVETKIGEIA